MSYNNNPYNPNTYGNSLYNNSYGSNNIYTGSSSYTYPNVNGMNIGNRYIPSNYNSIYNTGASTSSSIKRRRKQRLFSKDIETLLYALGDGPVSTDATINALEEILVEYLMDLCHKTLQYSKSQGRSRIKIDDIPFALRNDPLKLSRFLYILEQSSKIEKAKKMFEEKNSNYTENGLDVDDENPGKPEKEGKETKKKKRKVTGNVTLRTNDDE